MTRILYVLTAFLSLMPAAQAHLGHVGELAGHAHWVGVAATLGAAALAALVAKAGKKADEDGEDIESDPELRRYRVQAAR